jgi:hypothetical protein
VRHQPVFPGRLDVEHHLLRTPGEAAQGWRARPRREPGSRAIAHAVGNSDPAEVEPLRPGTDVIQVPEKFLAFRVRAELYPVLFPDQLRGKVIPHELASRRAVD